jgi:uroporphyrinogen-III synthase
VRSGPLAGWRVVVTREAERSEPLVDALNRHGAEAVLIPVLRTAEPSDGGRALARALGGLSSYDWLLLTSAAAVRAVRRHLGSAPPKCRTAAVGPATARAARDAGLVVDAEPHEATGAALAAVLGHAGGPQRALLPASDVARDEVPATLRQLGWEVDVVTAYRTLAVPAGRGALDRASNAHAITFLSPSAVDGWMHAAGPKATPPVVVVIGPTTAQRAAQRGLHVTAEADPHTVDGLLAALVVARRRSGAEPGMACP